MQEMRSLKRALLYGLRAWALEKTGAQMPYNGHCMEEAHTQDLTNIA